MLQFLPKTRVLALEYSDLVPGIMSETNYKYHRGEGNIKVHGRGGNGSKVLIEYDSLPRKFQAAYVEKNGDPYKRLSSLPILSLLRTDWEARTYYADTYRQPDGRELPWEYQQRYSRQADWLNMISLVLEDKRTLKETLRITMDKFWEGVIELHQQDKPVNPELPTSRERLGKKLKKYKTEGYRALVDAHRFGNSNSRKVDASIGNLLLALYCMRNKPTYMDVVRDYNDFMLGKKAVVDLETGEAYDPATYLVKGQAYMVTAETVKHYITKPANALLVDKLRLSAKEFNDRHRPHMIRKAAVFALSKLTMDDTSSPFKMHNGRRPATYKAFDVASGALIAMVMHKEERPDAALIRRLVMEMISGIVRNGWRMPYEIEVEHALNRSLRGKTQGGEQVETDLLTTGAVFPFVHFCAPRNPQEKRAEGFIRQIKQGYQRHREGFQYRPFSKLDSYRKNEDVTDVTYDFEQIHQMELADAAAWNNSLHHDQELYPGMTRGEVLAQNQNPSLPMPNLPLIMPYIGLKTPSTSLRRGRVQVQGKLYRLPDVRTVEFLDDTQFTAYWLPEADGHIERVYLYQDGVFITEATLEQRFQEARAEQTDEDLAILEQQRAYRDGFDKMVNEKASQLPRLGVVPTEPGQTLDLSPKQDAQTPDFDTKKSSLEGGFLQNIASSDPVFDDPQELIRRAKRSL